MSPEQLTGHESPPSDVWGFGCVVFFLITRHPPWKDSECPAAIRTAILVKRLCPRAPRDLPRGCPPAFAQLCNSCCQFEAESRPKFTEITKALAKLVHDFPDDSKFTVPRNWSSTGAGPDGLGDQQSVIEIRSLESDYGTIVSFFKDIMPAATVCRVEMNRNLELFRMYYWERDRIARSSPEGNPEEQANERWLWHGVRDARSIDAILQRGYQVQHASLDFNFYGVGNYFASDARLSNWFAQGLRQQQCGTDSGERKLILHRVACGKMGCKLSVLDASFNTLGRRLSPLTCQADSNILRSLLRRAEHRTAPKGFHSVLGADPSREARTEVIIFDNYLAFPAYVVTYNLPGDLPDPYLEPRPYLKSIDQVVRNPFA